MPSTSGGKSHKKHPPSEKKSRSKKGRGASKSSNGNKLGRLNFIFYIGGSEAKWSFFSVCRKDKETFI